MKRFLLALFIVVGSLGLKAQWVLIPDNSFGNWLNAHGYSACLQGSSITFWEMDTTCPALLTQINLDCSFGNIDDIEGIKFFRNLKTLKCKHNNLNYIPLLPDSLLYLECGTNQIQSFVSPLPKQLATLICLYNPLYLLPILPDSLKELNCSYTNVHPLPPLPNGITKLLCASCQLSTLPNLPEGITFLDCSSNNITSLPPLPISLTEFNCYGNHLTYFPPLPGGLKKLYCSFNSLNNIPELPDTLQWFDCSYNPQLSCLPHLTKIDTFYFGASNITCLPNYPESNFFSAPSLSTVPLCDIFNTNGCSVYWNISGEVYLDQNFNCLHDGTETYFTNAKVLLYKNGNLVEQSNLFGGTYSFVTDSGQYTCMLDTTHLPFSVSCPDLGYYTSLITDLDSTDAYRDFGLHCKPGFDLVAQSMLGGFRPGLIHFVKIEVGELGNFYGINCAIDISGSVVVVINGPAHYVSPEPGALMPTTVVGNTITWNVSDFGLVNLFSDFNIMVQTDTTAHIGNKICFTVSVTPTVGDNHPANNTLTHCFTVVGSFDPNIKEVYPIADIDTAQEWLTYTIHFQNTGTAEAQHVYVDDTLDTHLDAGSFQLLAYSHQPLVQIKQNAVRFNFPNINLPDSNTNEPASHGYVQYKIKLKDNLPVGTTINNTAFIYFDFNAPVVTNTTNNTITTTTAVSEIRNQKSEIRLFPNPTNTILNIQTENFNPLFITISDINGRKISEQKYAPQIDVSTLTSGIYFIELKGNDAIARKRFVKM